MNIDMTESFADRVKPTNVYRTTKYTIDFEPQESVELCTLNVAIQPAQPEDLKIDQVDWSKAYIWAYSTSELKINDEVEFCGDRYKIISLTNAKFYGYYKGIAEEVKKP